MIRIIFAIIPLGGLAWRPTNPTAADTKALPWTNQLKTATELGKDTDYAVVTTLIIFAITCPTYSRYSPPLVSGGRRNTATPTSTATMVADGDPSHAAQVCATCKTRKKKCDKVLPSCGYCVR